jgi:hypothetical protein
LLGFGSGNHDGVQQFGRRIRWIISDDYIAENAVVNGFQEKKSFLKPTKGQSAERERDTALKIVAWWAKPPINATVSWCRLGINSFALEGHTAGESRGAVRRNKPRCESKVRIKRDGRDGRVISCFHTAQQ